MKVIIIEDEKSNVLRLKKLLNELDPAIDIINCIESVEESINWFANNIHPDLVFMDIQLSDGLCFEIFSEINIDSPIIFITAYDEYALTAFKVNGIDYLLKPIDIKELDKSIKKYYNLKNKFEKSTNNNIELLLKNFETKRTEYKSRFLVKHKNSYVSISITEISYFYVDKELTYMMTFDNHKYNLDQTLDKIAKLVDPKEYFRLNRQFLAGIKSIKSIDQYFNGRLKIKLNPEFPDEVLISREKATEFKNWLER
jgi:two-component system, LytTR family, response regulator LytT